MSKIRIITYLCIQASSVWNLCLSLNALLPEPGVSNTLFCTLFLCMEPNANCMQPQMVCLQYAAETRKWGGIPYLRLDLCWLFCCQLRYWLKRRSSSASVRVTQRFGDVSIKLDLHLPSNSHIFYTIITTDDQINLGTLIECFTDCLCNEKKTLIISISMHVLNSI